MSQQKITTFLWFDTQAEEAASFYVSLFKDSRINFTSPGPSGSTMIVEFTLARIVYVAMNGGPQFPFTEAISLSINCDTQDEIDDLWTKLSSDGGSTSQCGWLKDKYGLSWQVVPTILPKMMSDPTKSKRVMQSLMQMTKLDIAKLQDAYDAE